MTPKETVLQFVRTINGHDVEALGKLMTKDHRFVDSHGHVIQNREELMHGWKMYFEWFPDYEIVVGETFEQGNVVSLFGAACGSFHKQKSRGWRIPAAWLAVMENGKVREWRVFADTKIPLASMH